MINLSNGAGLGIYICYYYFNDAVQKITGMYVDPIKNDLKRKASHIILYYYFIKKLIYTIRYVKGRAVKSYYP